MKKNYFILLFAFIYLCLPFSSFAQNDQLTSKEIKLIEKEAKKSAKRYEKEGYKLVGAGTMEGALTRFMMLTAPGSKYSDATEFIDNVGSITLGESRAQSAAEEQLTRSIKIAIKGEINTNSGGASKEDEVEAQVDIISRRIAEELKGDIVKYFTIYRISKTEKSKKYYDVMVFMTKPDINSPVFRSRINRTLDDNIELSKKIRDYLEQSDSDK